MLVRTSSRLERVAEDWELTYQALRNRSIGFQPRESQLTIHLVVNEAHPYLLIRREALCTEYRFRRVGVTIGKLPVGVKANPGDAV